MDIPCIVCIPLCSFVLRIDEFCSPVVHRLFCKYSQILRVSVEIARMAETLLSFPVRIGKSRQSLLHVEFVVAGALVAVCDRAGRIGRSINRSRLHAEVNSVLTRFAHLEGEG